MADVLEELTADTLVRAQIERRVDDWVRRIEALYALVGSWLPLGWTVQAGRRSVRMQEEPMREVGLPPRALPVLDLLADGAPAASIEPRGLWIIGTNGRLDLRIGRSHFLILDRAAHFEPPHWVLVPMAARHLSEPFDRTTLRAALA